MCVAAALDQAISRYRSGFNLQEVAAAAGVVTQQPQSSPNRTKRSGDAKICRVVSPLVHVIRVDDRKKTVVINVDAHRSGLANGDSPFSPNGYSIYPLLAPPRTAAPRRSGEQSCTITSRRSIARGPSQRPLDISRTIRKEKPNLSAIRSLLDIIRAAAMAPSNRSCWLSPAVSKFFEPHLLGHSYRQGLFSHHVSACFESVNQYFSLLGDGDHCGCYLNLGIWRQLLHTAVKVRNRKLLCDLARVTPTTLRWWAGIESTHAAEIRRKRLSSRAKMSSAA